MTAKTARAGSGRIQLDPPAEALAPPLAGDVLDALPQAVAVLHEDRRVAYANQAFLDFLQTDTARAIGQPLLAIMDGLRDPAGIASCLDQLLLEGRACATGRISHANSSADTCTRDIVLHASWMGGCAGAGRRILLRLDDTTRSPRGPSPQDAGDDQASVLQAQFLALVGHEMRQPLQTIRLLCDVLAQKDTDGQNDTLLRRLDSAAALLSEHVASLIGIHQLQAGPDHADHADRADRADLAVADLLGPLVAEFSHRAEIAGVTIRYVPSSLVVHSVPHLLEWAVRSLLLHALKYAEGGTLLIGCRRRGDSVRIKIRGDAILVPQKDDLTGEGSLGRAIAIRLAKILGHTVTTQEKAGALARFAIDVPMADAPDGARSGKALGDRVQGKRPGRGRILVVEDDPVVRELLDLLLDGAGYDVRQAPDGAAALELVMAQGFTPQLMVSDYRLPLGMTGVETVRRVRAAIGEDVPAIVLSGDSSAETLRAIAAMGCRFLGKPINGKGLLGLIELALPPVLPPADPPPGADKADVTDAKGETIYVIEDEPTVAEAMRDLLRMENYRVEVFKSCHAFLQAHPDVQPGLYLVDARLPGMDGLAFLRQLKAAGNTSRVILMTGFGDVRMAVDAIRAGAFDFLEKPIGRDLLLSVIREALLPPTDGGREAIVDPEAAARRVPGLTERQRQVLLMVLAGKPSKIIAADLGLSQRTVENHRAAIMQKIGVRSIPEMIRTVLAGR